LPVLILAYIAGIWKAMKNKPNIIEALRNKKLFGSLPEFRDLTTWFSWVV
jgi:hypothetical protein